MGLCPRAAAATASVCGSWRLRCRGGGRGCSRAPALRRRPSFASRCGQLCAQLRRGRWKAGIGGLRRCGWPEAAGAPHRRAAARRCCPLRGQPTCQRGHGRLHTASTLAAASAQRWGAAGGAHAGSCGHGCKCRELFCGHWQLFGPECRSMGFLSTVAFPQTRRGSHEAACKMPPCPLSRCRPQALASRTLHAPPLQPFLAAPLPPWPLLRQRLVLYSRPRQGLRPQTPGGSTAGGSSELVVVYQRRSGRRPRRLDTSARLPQVRRQVANCLQQVARRRRRAVFTNELRGGAFTHQLARRR